MIGTKGKINGKEKEYKPNSYHNQSMLVKDFFDSVPIATKNTYDNSTQSKSTLNQSTQFIPTPQIGDLPSKKSYITAYQEMQSRMKNGESPTQEDMKILMKLSAQKLDSNFYSSKDEQLRLALLSWGGVTPKPNTLMSNNGINANQFMPTPQISELPSKKSYTTAYQEMQSRMKNGESPTQEDMKILMKLSEQKLDPNIYSYDDEQFRLELLDWGGITPQIKTLRVEKSYPTRFKEMQSRMKNGETPTIDDMDILWNLSKNDLDPTFYDEKAKRLRLDLLSWGGFSDNSNMQKQTYTIDDYEDLYKLTDISQIDAMIARLQKQKASLQNRNSIDGQNINTLE